MASETTTDATVVICTRDRGDKIVATVESVLASRTSHLRELLIIDQSSGAETHDALAPFFADERVRYLQSSERGVARSRSRALLESTTEFVINTDDDCVVDPDWVEANVQALIEHPSAAIVFGDVIAPDVDIEGYAPESIADADFVVDSIWSWRTTDGANVGIGASMAMRRSVLIELGGFDHELGPGSKLRNAEDTDMTLRALFAGNQIVRTTAARVDHFGHRSHDDFRELTRGAMLGLGAMSGKLIRTSPIATSWFLAGLVFRLVVRVTISDLIRARKPPVLGRAVSIAKGFWTGLRRPLDRNNRTLFAELQGDDGNEGVDDAPRPRIAFITEQHVGLKTYSDNLRTFVDHDERVDAHWAPVTYTDERSPWSRLPGLPSGVRATLIGASQVRRALRAIKPDAVLFLTQVPAALGGRRARRMPSVVMADDTPALFKAMSSHYGIINDDPAPLRRLKHRANVRSLRAASAVLPMSEWARRSMIDTYGVSANRAIVVPTGIDLAAWAPRSDRDDSPSSVRVLFVGGHFERKGGSVLLDAIDRLDPASIELDIVTRSDVDAGPNRRVHRGLNANSPELIELFRSADVFVLPSRAEAFPNVIVEACAAGLACVVTNVGGMAEMVTDGESGFVVPTDDAGALADRLRRFIDDPELSGRMGDAARRRATEMYDGRVNARRVVDLLLDAQQVTG